MIYMASYKHRKPGLRVTIKRVILFFIVIYLCYYHLRKGASTHIIIHVYAHVG